MGQEIHMNTVPCVPAPRQHLRTCPSGSAARETHVQMVTNPTQSPHGWFSSLPLADQYISTPAAENQAPSLSIQCQCHARDQNWHHEKSFIDQDAVGICGPFASCPRLVAPADNSPAEPRVGMGDCCLLQSCSERVLCQEGEGRGEGLGARDFLLNSPALL